ncbi:hypothetical protein DM860_005965 [Cuscuta australis]|uniref:Protein POLYCHOME n=1 Tax=Cuscuta australis TaxID=267555 RepID=A0A328DWI1_9ASTE|nr:hypothetical protein DM860_005965 [Cuscuta australis]
MPEARDRIMRAVDLAELYIRRRQQLAFGSGGNYRWGETASPGAETPAAPDTSGRVRRSPFSRRGRGGGRRQVQPRRSELPSWYPRRPLQDITAITRAYQRRRERLRGEGGDEQPETPMFQVYTDVEESAYLEHNNPSTTPLAVRLCPPSSSSKPDKEWEYVTPQRKLLDSIDKVEKALKEELEKMKRTPSAKKAEREKKVRTLMTMR